MKFFVTIYNDAKLLGHFLKHYSIAGVTEFFIAVPPQFTTRVAQFCNLYRIMLFDHLDVTDCIIGENSAITEMRRLNQNHDEWVIVIDLDEFIEFGASIDCITSRADKAGANVVRGIMHDRFSADGKLANFEADSDLASVFPIKSRFIRNVMGGCDHKGVLVKGHLRPEPGANHHRFQEERVFSKVLEISHYKWIAGALDRLEDTHEIISRAGIHWAAEHQRVFDHYNAHGRFAFEKFGGSRAENFRVEPPDTCTRCGGAISEAERDYSLLHFRRALCRADQKVAGGTR